MTSIKAKMLSVFQKMPDFKTNILSQIKGTRLWITFNRPNRFNAFTMDMYTKLAERIIEANRDDRVKYIIINGKGGNFSSGNDLNNFKAFVSLDVGIEEATKAAAETLFDLTAAIIDSRKPIFAITEGRTIGFAFTQLLMYDQVWSVQGGDFSAPLVKLAQGPQMCSSYLFPRRFGHRLGEQLIVGGLTVAPAFLEKHGLAISCRSRSEAEQRLEKHLSELDELDWQAYLSSRQLFRDTEREVLHKVNRKEADNLAVRWSNPDLVPFLMNYLSKAKAKAKL